MDAYLERFERFAKNNKWQEDVWATHLSALLTSKSVEFTSRLPREEADDYRMLKLALLRHYDYTEEGYRRKFRGCKPEEGETPALFIERVKVTEQQGAFFDNPLETAISKGKSIPSKVHPSPQHKAASIVMPAEETSERRHGSLEQNLGVQEGWTDSSG